MLLNPNIRRVFSSEVAKQKNKGRLIGADLTIVPSNTSSTSHFLVHSNRFNVSVLSQFAEALRITCSVRFVSIFYCFLKMFLVFFKYPSWRGCVAVYSEPPYICAYTVFPYSCRDSALMGSGIDR